MGNLCWICTVVEEGVGQARSCPLDKLGLVSSLCWFYKLGLVVEVEEVLVCGALRQ